MKAWSALEQTYHNVHTQTQTGNSRWPIHWSWSSEEVGQGHAHKVSNCGVGQRANQSIV